ncbi:hypothetical protein [Nonlabens xiamenensis]|uniref:hypothetical protein n=1 Tax=Nonlabens xiamenensis TaxID=2341043 RepID=UPI000F610518|nr:hypothetical protein [Nonlabens xiamenensis]
MNIIESNDVVLKNIESVLTDLRIVGIVDINSQDMNGTARAKEGSTNNNNGESQNHDSQSQEAKNNGGSYDFKKLTI